MPKPANIAPASIDAYFDELDAGIAANASAVSDEANTRETADLTLASAVTAAQAYAVQRANHTGVQAISTVTGLQAALDARSLLPLFALKSSDQTKNNDAVLGDITDLSLAVEANATYIVQAYLAYNSSATADIRFAFTAPASSTLRWTPAGSSTSASVTGDLSFADLALANAAALGGAGASDVVARPLGRLVVSSTAGDFRAQFRQSTPEVSDTIVRAGSWLMLQRIA